jgi:hypothetical protein
MPSGLHYLEEVKFAVKVVGCPPGEYSALKSLHQLRFDVTSDASMFNLQACSNRASLFYFGINLIAGSSYS